MWASTRACFLVPDRPEAQVALVDAERPFGFRQLHVRPPEFLRPSSRVTLLRNR